MFDWTPDTFKFFEEICLALEGTVEFLTISEQSSPLNPGKHQHLLLNWHLPFIEQSFLHEFASCSQKSL